MKMTAYDLGQAKPPRARHLPPNHAVPPEEKRRRLVIAKKAREQFPSLSAMSRAIGIPSGTTSQWFTGVRPVPEKHLPALKALVGGEDQS